jgi:pantoate--beta-alanine ligase
MPDTVPIVVEIADLRSAVAATRARGSTIGFVPTMGALHEGHAALVRQGTREAGFTVVSIFVNPTQFGPNEDLAKYPRTLDADRETCRQAGADLIFAPTVETMYPAGAVTTVEVGELDRHLCGPRRPGHFRGVCTVVAKLFNLVQPDVAIFGRKDAQQLRILQRMTIDLNFPVRIVAGDTVREADGLAMSSRNRYLKATERGHAAMIFRSLTKLRERAHRDDDVRSLESLLKGDLASIPGARIDYAQIVDDATLQPLDRLDRPALAAVAVFVGTTRLIDNIELPVPRS